MASQRLSVALMLIVLVLMLASGYWLWGRLQDLAPPPAPPPAPTATATRTVTPLATIVQAPPGYRLAGVAVGEPESFAVVEAPSGAHALYRVGDEVPGLGRLLRIEAERVVVQGERGQFDVWLSAASTATPGRTPSPLQGTPAPTARPQSGTPGAGTTPGSTPSSARGRSAS